jgi:transcriptional regulator with XRE-family HTH domain
MTEYERAKRWREARGQSRQQLAQLTGFSPRSIEAYESGMQPSGQPVPAESMRRYRLVCAAIHHRMEGFRWE